MRSSIKFDDGAKGFLIILLISQFFFASGIFLFAGMLVFFIIFYNIQQPFKPSVFTIILIYHFIQISAGVWQCNYLDKPIDYRSASTIYAIVVSYIGLLFLFLPIIYYQNKIPKLSFNDLKKYSDKLSIDKIFKVYVISFFGMNTLIGVAFLIPSIAQIIISLGNVKWFLFLLFGFQSIIQNRKRKEFYIFCALEFALGFFSYFSEFKTIIFYGLFLALFFLRYLKFKNIAIASIAIIAMVFGGIFWTSIKGNYRNFINKGSSTQSVQVEKRDALNKLLELSETQNANTFKGATASFLDRLQYTYHLAKAMDRVPSLIPYQDGQNWLSTLTFILTPRIIDANKGTYDASIKATKYTGIYYNGIKKGTSVSLGYFADGYIDFGYVGMFIPLLILGFIYGRSYFYFIKKSSNNFIFNFAVVGAIYMELFSFESDGIFVAGRLYVNLFVFFLLRQFLFKPLLRYISVPVKPVIE